MQTYQSSDLRLPDAGCGDKLTGLGGSLWLRLLWMLPISVWELERDNPSKYGLKEKHSLAFSNYPSHLKHIMFLFTDDLQGRYENISAERLSDQQLIYLYFTPHLSVKELVSVWQYPTDVHLQLFTPAFFLPLE